MSSKFYPKSTKHLEVLILNLKCVELLFHKLAVHYVLCKCVHLNVCNCQDWITKLCKAIFVLIAPWVKLSIYLPKMKQQAKFKL